jgi:hypothetical protein
MRIPTPALAALLTCAIAHGEEEGRFRYEYPGYDDAPRIPGSEFRVHQKDRPQPPRVRPPGPAGGEGPAAPSDATVLFDGTTLDRFEKTAWKVEGGVLVAGAGDLVSRTAYGDCQFHVEWRAPDPPSGRPANMGNSGIFFMGLYELQIYDSFSSKIYADGSAAAIYGQTPPLVNACRRPGLWQSYDVVFRAPVFEEGRLIRPARVTALHNGVLVHDNTEVLGPTAHRAARPYRPHAPRLPIRIQGHSSPVRFRNIWVRTLDP